MLNKTNQSPKHAESLKRLHWLVHVWDDLMTQPEKQTWLAITQPATPTAFNTFIAFNMHYKPDPTGLFITCPSTSTTTNPATTPKTLRPQKEP